MERTDFEQWKGKEVARLLALVETERRYYQEMVATLPVALAVLSMDRAVVLVNRAFRQTFGLRVDEIRRKTIEQILPSDELIERIRAVHMDSAERVGRPGLILEAAGKVLRVDVSPIRNWDEDIGSETLLTIQDASNVDVSHFDSSSAIQASVARSAPGAMPGALVSPFPTAALPAIVWQADAETLRFVAVSGGATSSMDLAPSRWLESQDFFEQRIHADDREATMALYRSLIEHGGEASAEFRLIAGSGAPRWCRETVFAVTPRAGSGTLYGVLTFIAGRVQIQHQMEAAARHTALTGLSARLAHDLNNPLMVIAGYAEEMMQGLPTGDPRRDDAQQILDATARITELTGHLLRFTRRGTTHPGSVDVAALLHKLESRFASICGRSVTLHLAVEEQVWGFADLRSLEELVLALAGAATDGASKLTVGCDLAEISEQIPGATLAPGIYARISVHNDVPGSDIDDRPSLFESILSKGESSGQNGILAHAYGLVREWGGDIAYAGDASSSAFLVYLRRSAAGETVPEETAAAVYPTPRTLILVVDDEPGIRALVAKILRREQYEVIEASSANEAEILAAAQQRPVELLVTDVMLPDRQGPELAAQLHNALPGLKILYISGYTDDPSVRAGDFPPGSRFLQKPFTLGALVAKVRESLEQT